MIYCITFTDSIVSDDVRDMLFQTAYLMLKGGQKRKKFRSKECSGVVVTKFQPLVYVGTSGIEFTGIVESEEGENTITYLVRDQDLAMLEQAKEGAWLSGEDMLSGNIPEEKWRPNPIRRVAHGNN